MYSVVAAVLDILAEEKKDFSSLHQTLIIRVTQLKIQLGERIAGDKLSFIYIYIYMYKYVYV